MAAGNPESPRRLSSTLSDEELLKAIQENFDAVAANFDLINKQMKQQAQVIDENADILDLDDLPEHYHQDANDGGGLTTGAIPTDGQAPDSSPTPEVLGGVGFLAVRWLPITNADPVTYEVHISITTGFTPDAGTLAGEVSGGLYFIRTTPDGEPLLYFDTDGVTPLVYYVKIVAKDDDGSAAAGGQASDHMIQVTGPDIAANTITAGNILAGEITAGLLQSPLILAGTIKTAQDGQRVEISSANGVYLFAPDGVTPLVTLPTQEGLPATFSGSVVADDLTVEDIATYRGTGSLTGNGQLGPQVGVADPTAAPTVYNYLEEMTLADGYTSPRRALYYDDTYWYWLTGREAVWRATAAGAYSAFEVAESPANDWTHESICYSPNTSRWYILSRKDGGNNLRIFVYTNNGSNMPGTRVNEVSLSTTTFAQETSMSYEKATGKLWIMATNAIDGTARRYTLSGNDITFDTSVALDSISGASFLSGCKALYVGPGDFGATRIIAAGAFDDYYYSWDSAGTAQSGEHWLVAAGYSDGMDYDTDTGRFCEISSSEDILWKFHTWTESAWPNKYQVAYTWTDTDATGGTHESELSPRTALNHYGRRGVFVSWPTIPDMGGTDDPNAVTIYTLDQDTDPGDAHASYKDQGTATGTGLAFPTAFSTASNGTKDTAFPTAGTGPYAPLKANGDGFIPVGSIMAFTSATPPAGWLLCDGSVVSRTTYAALFGVVSTTFNTGGEAGTDFRLPNLSGRHIAMVGTGVTLAEAGGATAHSTSADHAHGAGSLDVTNDHNIATNTQTTAGGADRASNGAHSISGTTADNGAHAHDAHTYSSDNVPPFLGLYYIVKF